MKRILALVGLACLLASCSKVGQKFDQSNSGSPGAATTGNSSSSTAGASTTSKGASTSADATGGETVERATPTAAQLAVLEGGQEIKWDQQGMSWTVPKGWVKGSVETKNFMWHSASGGDLASLIAYVSPMGEDFPTDISLKAYYDQAVGRKKNGELEDVRWLEIDGVKGVAFREAMPEGKDDPRRLQWITYRKFAGQSQMVSVMLATTGKGFEKNQDTFYGILYSTKLVH
jgi:hypothetical protein